MNKFTRGLHKVGKGAGYVFPVYALANNPKGFFKEVSKWSGKLFGSKGKGGEDPKSYLDQITEQDKSYYDPYLQRGTAAYNTMDPILQNMSKDPASYLQRVMDQYSSSPMYQGQKNEAMNVLGKAAASGGYQGNLGSLANQTGLEASLKGPAMQDWFNNVLGVQQQGLGGQMDIYGKGYGAAENMASDISNVLGTKGSLEFQNQRNQQQTKNDIMSSIAGMGGMFGGMLSGGGSSGSPYSYGGNAPSNYRLGGSSPSSRYSLWG